MNIIERLEQGAEWIEGNGQYHFKNEQNHYALNKSEETAKAMRDAAELLRNMGVGKRPFANEQ